MKERKELMDGRQMQRQQRHGEGSELAMEECLHNGEEEDGSDNPEDKDHHCDSINEEDDLRHSVTKVLRTKVSRTRSPMSIHSHREQPRTAQDCAYLCSKFDS